ncbi:stage II sporulation protein R [Desulfosporosinus sp. Sb-LF]|uniref:stage II sporulation protein R n=1 Tax=Desulfosporosinus sp. Sb-LF TaxID=2560027 RepID=UPI00107F3691|nr:stage II sporulation protein R [Desulfosporosinus sp. Sb-LF]TGE34040.1 stage II sporulation protein R [Desulfosporosinus sp. Sb-LF]
MKAVNTIIISLIAFMLIGAFWGPIRGGNATESNKVAASSSSNEKALASTPDQLIRFHVLANSDNEQDQALKRAVRDAILKEVSPRLAVSRSLSESRQLLKQVRPDMEDIGRSVVKAWGKDYSVHTEYGHFSFPTKSYGTLVLPAGDYEALRVVIGEGQGSNWWCVLFPPLCFVDIDHSTAVQVDGKPGIPLKNELRGGVSGGVNRGVKNEALALPINQTYKTTKSSPKIRFFFWEMVNRLTTAV